MGLFSCVVYNLQAREITKRRHHISAYRIKHYNPRIYYSLANNKSRNNIQIVERDVQGVSINIYIYKAFNHTGKHFR